MLSYRPLSPAIAFIVTCIGLVATSSSQEVSRRDERVLSLLKRPFVRKELRLENAQIEDLIRLESERQLLWASPLAKFDQVTREERAAAYEELKRQLTDLERQAMAVLLPDQKRRLGQILVQKYVRSNEPAAGLQHPEMISKLNITESQQESLRTIAMKAEAEFKRREAELLAQIERAKKAARSEVLSVLDNEQRKKYEDLVGEPFDLTKFD
jgi:hypothetical protein